MVRESCQETRLIGDVIWPSLPTAAARGVARLSAGLPGGRRMCRLPKQVGDGNDDNGGGGGVDDPLSGDAGRPNRSCGEQKKTFLSELHVFFLHTLVLDALVYERIHAGGSCLCSGSGPQSAPRKSVRGSTVTTATRGLLPAPSLILVIARSVESPSLVPHPGTPRILMGLNRQMWDQVGLWQRVCWHRQ